jgi:hypothetical protein
MQTELSRKVARIERDYVGHLGVYERILLKWFVLIRCGVGWIQQVRVDLVGKYNAKKSLSRCLR